MLNLLRTAAAALALAGATAAHAALPLSGLYVGEIGAGNQVLVSLQPGAPATLTGEYHYARIWAQDRLELNGKLGRDGRIVIRETLVGQNGQRSRTGIFKGRVWEGGSEITGTWASNDGRSVHAFVLVRAAEWSRQSVKADGGVRTCVRPRFFDTRYDKVNRDLAEACDYFLADGHEGPGLLTLAIDSVSGPVVAAVAYATTRGRELPPEVITVDTSSSEGETENPLSAALASHQ